MPNKRWMIPMISIALALPLLLAQTNAGAAAQLQAAINKETVEGDLKGAIAQYQKLADRFKTSDPATAAKALLRMGECYDKLGDAEASKAYERVVRDFPSQKDSVVEARRRLAAKTTGAESAAVARKVLDFDEWFQEDSESVAPRGVVQNQTISRDGRFVAVLKKGAVVAHDLATGQEHRIASPASSGEALLDALISPDGKRVGYTRHVAARTELYLAGADGSNPHMVLAGKDGEDLMLVGISPDNGQVAYLRVTRRPVRWDLCVAGVDGSNPRVLLSSGKPDPAELEKLSATLKKLTVDSKEPGPDAEEVELMAAGIPEFFSWSSDGKHGLVGLLNLSNAVDVRCLLISVADGSTRVIPKADGGEFSPDGKYVAFQRVSQLSDLASLDLNTGVSVMPVEGGSEVQAYSGEVNNFIWTPDGKLLFDRSRPDQARGLSDLYTLRVVDGKPQGSPELVKKDVHLGNIQVVSPDGNYYYTDRRTRQVLYEVGFDPNASTPVGEPKLIAEGNGNTQGPSWSPDGEWVAYLSIGGTERNALVVRSAKSGEERRWYPQGITASAEAEQPARSLQWFPDNRSLLLGYANGELFRFDTRTGESRRILDNVKIPWIENSAWGSAIATPDGRTVFYEPPGDQKRIMRRDLNGGPEQEVCRIPGDRIHGFNISPDGSQLALIVTYARGTPNEYRTLMTVAASGGQPKEVARPKGLARMLIWSKDGRYLIFNTRPDQQQKNEFFSVSAEGGEPRPFGIKLHTLDFPTLSPDGRRMIFQDGGANRNELWVMKLPPSISKPSQ